MRESVVGVHTAPQGQVRGLILLTFDLRREGDVWLGTCLELGTSTYADTLDGLREEMFDAVSLQLNEVQRLGFSSEYLREQGVAVLPIPEQSLRAEEAAERWGLVTAEA